MIHIGFSFHARSLVVLDVAFRNQIVRKRAPVDRQSQRSRKQREAYGRKGLPYLGQRPGKRADDQRCRQHAQSQRDRCVISLQKQRHVGQVFLHIHIELRQKDRKKAYVDNQRIDRRSPQREQADSDHLTLGIAPYKAQGQKNQHKEPNPQRQRNERQGIVDEPCGETSRIGQWRKKSMENAGGHLTGLFRKRITATQQPGRRAPQAGRMKPADACERAKHHPAAQNGQRRQATQPQPGTRLSPPTPQHQHQRYGQPCKQDADLLYQHHGAQRQTNAPQACPVVRLQLPNPYQRIPEA